MTIAELHGKLSSSSPDSITDRMEDLLTSDVFGTIRYAGIDCGFLDWLHTAAPMPIATGFPAMRDIIPAQGLRAVGIAFWPKLLNRREPDVALLLQYCSDAVLIVVEAKYLSGMSDFESDDSLVTGNQVVDQVKGIADATDNDVAAWFASVATRIRVRLHLLVTAHSVMPDIVYADALEKLALPWPTMAYWLSWTTLAAALSEPCDEDDPGRAAMIRDLRCLLHRKRLVPYNGLAKRLWIAPRDGRSFWGEAWWRRSAFESPSIRHFWGN